MRETRVESWLELQELIFAESWNERLGRFRSNLVYRGENRAAIASARSSSSASVMRTAGRGRGS